MKYLVDQSIFEKHPEFYRVVIVLRNVDNSQKINWKLQKEFKNVIKQIADDDSITLSNQKIKEWVGIYKKFEQPERKVLPSVGALVKRIKSGDGDRIPLISPLVCISNMYSLVNLVPSGLIDADTIKGNVKLGYATGNEVFNPIGESRTTEVNKNEIIYYDTKTNIVLCRAWNSRGGRDTFIRSNTSNVLFDLDGLTSVIDKEKLMKSASSALSMITQHCGGDGMFFILDKENPNKDVIF